MTEKMEITQTHEVSKSVNMENELARDYMRNSAEMESVGNRDMAEYYAKKAKEAEAKPDTDEAKLGGWYAGYTPAEWRRMASEEYAKNGNTIEYRRRLKNAEKAEG